MHQHRKAQKQHQEESQRFAHRYRVVQLSYLHQTQIQVLGCSYHQQALQDLHCRCL